MHAETLSRDNRAGTNRSFYIRDPLMKFLADLSHGRKERSFSSTLDRLLHLQQILAKNCELRLTRQQWNVLMDVWPDRPFHPLRNLSEVPHQLTAAIQEQEDYQSSQVMMGLLEVLSDLDPVGILKLILEGEARYVKRCKAK